MIENNFYVKIQCICDVRVSYILRDRPWYNVSRFYSTLLENSTYIMYFIHV